jgi:predicted ATP-grasp superfamily ATP-dependent carboligase
MRVGAFKINEPLPELKTPHVFAMLEPWIDAGDVGKLTLAWLERHTQAKPLAELVKPGNFYDFTRYRPMTFSRRGQRHIDIPNTHITYGKLEKLHDFIFLHLLEPHIFGELYVESVSRVLDLFDVKRYCLIGSMYNFVPHTRPPLVSGGASPDYLKQEIEKLGVSSGNYQGPTTICTLISQRMTERDIENITMIVSLPQYTQLDENFTGVVRLEEIISSLYGIPVSADSLNKASRQREEISTAIAENTQIQDILQELEESYDARLNESEDKEEPPAPLSPQVEEFLREMERRFRRE